MDAHRVLDNPVGVAHPGEIMTLPRRPDPLGDGRFGGSVPDAGVVRDPDGRGGAPTAGDPTKQVLRLTAGRGQDHDASRSEPPGRHRDERLSGRFQEFGERIRLHRQTRGWSKRELGSRSGIDPTTLSRIEVGRNITLEVLWRLANALEMSWADLLDDRPTGPGGADHLPAPFARQLAAMGARLYEIRTGQHLSQRALARHTGVNHNTIGSIEQGTQNIQLGTLVRLAVGLGVHWADLLDDRQAAPPRPEPRLPETLEQVAQLRTELQQLRTQLTLAQARAAVAGRVAEQAAVQRLRHAADQARLLFDTYDRPHLAALRPSQLAAHLTARRTLYDYLDRICRHGQREHLDHRPEWASMVALRDLTRHLTETVLDVRMRGNQP